MNQYLKFAFICIASLFIGVFIHGGLTEFVNYKVFFANDNNSRIFVSEILPCETTDKYEVFFENTELHPQDTIYHIKFYISDFNVELQAYENSEKLYITNLSTNLPNKNIQEYVSETIKFIEDRGLKPYISCGVPSNPTIFRYSELGILFCQISDWLYNIFLPVWTLLLGILLWSSWQLIRLYRKNKI